MVFFNACLDFNYCSLFLSHVNSLSNLTLMKIVISNLEIKGVLIVPLRNWFLQTTANATRLQKIPHPKWVSFSVLILLLS